MIFRAEYCILFLGLLLNSVASCLNNNKNFKDILQNRPHVAALILARGGSKGVVLKNIEKVAGKSLISRALDQLILESGFDSIWVSTDNFQIYLEVLKYKSVNIHWRSAESATDSASSLAAIQEFLLHHSEINFIALIQCTSPFLKREYLQKALQLLLFEKYQCVFSVTRSSKLLWQGKSGNLIPINFPLKNRPRRQEFVQYQENGMFYFTSRKMIKNGQLQNNRFIYCKYAGTIITIMTTVLSSAAIPVFYRDLYKKCSNNDEPIHKDIYKALLSYCNLEDSQLKLIWDLVGPTKQAQGIVNRTNFYKTLALIAWSQNGKNISENLFDSFTGDEYPVPKFEDLTEVFNLKQKLFIDMVPDLCNNYQKLAELDSVSVQLVPEKKGLFLKYSEYLVTSKRLNAKVLRRYNDFVALQELLLNRFPYRLVPNLPPKKIVINNAQFLEERTRALQRWLTLVCRHPILCYDSIIAFFLTDEGSDLQHRIRNVFRKVPDEFMTSDIAATAKELLPPDNVQISVSRDNIRCLVNNIGKLRQHVESLVEQSQNAARDIDDISAQLRQMSTVNMSSSSSSSLANWNFMQKCFVGISKELKGVSKSYITSSDYEQIKVCERLALLYDILVAHKELCERLEKGLVQDHQAALSKMLALKKKKFQGAIRGTNSDECVEELEGKMLAQENIISNIDLRTDFSLFCVHMETQLVFAYLGTMPSILNSFVDLKMKSHFELLDLWRNLQNQYCTNNSVKEQ